MTFKRTLFLLLGFSLLISACAQPTESLPEMTPMPDARPTRTATLPPSPIPTYTPAGPIINLGVTADCYAGPGDTFDVIATIEVNPYDDGHDYQYDLLGTSGEYWLILGPTGEECWVKIQSPLMGTLSAPQTIVTPPATPTLITPTAAPLAVDNIMVKKKKCTVLKIYDPYPHYEVDILFIIEWDDVVGEEGYWVFRDGNRVGELPANTTVFSETFRLKKPGRTSTFYIVSYNSLGETRSAQFSFANPC